MNRKLVWEKPSDFVKILRKQRNLEKSHVEALKPSIKAISNRLVSALLESIVHDSLKHATFCEVLIDIETGVVPLEMDIGDALDMFQVIEEHIEVEADMIKRLEFMLKKGGDDKIKGILRYMLSDERRHHNMLKKIADLSKISIEDFYEA